MNVYLFVTKILKFTVSSIDTCLGSQALSGRDARLFAYVSRSQNPNEYPSANKSTTKIGQIFVRTTIFVRKIWKIFATIVFYNTCEIIATIVFYNTCEIIADCLL